MFKVSVIIISFNTKDLTLEAVKSVYENSKDVSFEAIVVDNNSQDGSVEVLREFGKNRKNFVLIENKDNLGFARANNQAAKKVKGEYLFLLNSDTKTLANAIKTLLDFAEKTSNAGVVGPQLLNGDGTIQPSAVNFPTIKNAIRQYFLGKKGLFDKYVPKGKNPAVVDALAGAAFLITPKALKKVGLLDERYFFYFEDIDYCRRVKKAGLKVYYLPEVKIIHYHGVSGKTLAPQKDQWKRLIPSSKVYHGLLGHYLLTAVLWLGQKWERLFGSPNK
jgi:GT2 family glycosyltransferase